MCTRSHPAEGLRGRVSAISETPIDFSEGTFYEVTLEVENPEGRGFRVRQYMST